MFLEVRIVKELWAHFSEVRILKGLMLKRRLEAGCQRNRGERQAFELMFVITQSKVPYW